MSGKSKREKAPKPAQYKTYKDWCIDLALHGKRPSEIRQITGVAKATAWKHYKKVRDQVEKKEGIEPSEAEVIPIVKKIEEVPTIPTGREKVEKIITGAVAEGGISVQACIGIFKGVNDWFPPAHRRPDDSIQALGEVWQPVLQRLLLTIENIDIVIAVVVTLIVFAPAIKGTLDDRHKEAERKKKEKEKVE